MAELKEILMCIGIIIHGIMFYIIGRMNLLERFILHLNDSLTADVAEVNHGEWVDRDGKTWCSLCDASNKQYKPPYCPCCGAKMDGGKSNEKDS